MGLCVILTSAHVSPSLESSQGCGEFWRILHTQNCLTSLCPPPSLSVSTSLFLSHWYTHNTHTPSLIQFSSCCQSVLSEWWLTALSCVKGQQARWKERVSWLFENQLFLEHSVCLSVSQLFLIRICCYWWRMVRQLVWIGSVTGKTCSDWDFTEWIVFWPQTGKARWTAPPQCLWHYYYCQ